MSDEQDVIEVSKQWLEANNRGDTGWLRENLTDDYYMHNANGSHYRGIDHICALWDEYRKAVSWDGKGEPDDFHTEMTEPVEAQVHGDHAFVAYRFKVRVVPVAEGWMTPPGVPMEGLVNATDVLRREDGRWKIVHGHYSLANPGQPAGGL